MKMKLQVLLRVCMLCVATNVAWGEGRSAGDLLGDLEGAEFLKEGKVLFDARLRYEFLDQDFLSESNAFTGRIRLGYETADFHGFKGLIEMEHTSAINQENNYRQGAFDPPGKGVIADPENTEVNRVNLSYVNEDWESSAKLGRQRVILGNSRFVGNIGWRQNEQTMDGARIDIDAIDDVTLTYAYIWQVNRIFGLNSDAPTGVGRAQSESHLVNVNYTGCEYFKLTGYAYILDFESSGLSGSNTNNFGISFDGKYEMDEDWTFIYYGEYAYQESANGNTAGVYDADYFHVKAGAKYDVFKFGVGYEFLGADNGLAFQFPLGTNHKFNGWADVFLTTPTGAAAAGLRDLYAWVGVKLPGDIPVKVVYHNFESDQGTVEHLGDEIDVVASKKIGDNWKVVGKYAYFTDGDAGSPADRSKFSMEVNFKF